MHVPFFILLQACSATWAASTPQPEPSQVSIAPGCSNVPTVVAETEGEDAVQHTCEELAAMHACEHVLHGHTVRQLCPLSCGTCRTVTQTKLCSGQAGETDSSTFASLTPTDRLADPAQALHAVPHSKPRADTEPLEELEELEELAGHAAANAADAADDNDDDDDEGRVNSIVLGADASATSWPSYTKIRACGATLVAPDKVLTAAHCVTEGAWGDPEELRSQFVDVGPVFIGKANSSC